MKKVSNLQRMRNDRGLSQSQLGKVAGVSFRLVQEYEQRRKDINGAACMTVYRLAKALDCSMEDLMEFEDDDDALCT